MLDWLVDYIFAKPALFTFFRATLLNNFAVQRVAIANELKPGQGEKVLDVACGTGIFADEFEHCDYTGVDISEEYIKSAPKHHKGNFRVMDARKLEFGDGCIDKVYIYGLFHHLPDEDASKVAPEVARVVKKNGKILIIEDIPALSRLNILGGLVHRMDRGDYIRTIDGYKDLFSPHMKIEKTYTIRAGPCDYGVYVATPGS